MNALSPLVRPGNHRLIIGLALSALLHGLVVSNVGPQKKAGHLPTSLLEVNFTSSSPLVDEPITGDIGKDKTTSVVAPRKDSQPRPPARDQSILAPADAASPPTTSYAPLRVGMPSEKYHSAREVDVRAVQINQVEMVYPSWAYETRTKGRVVLRIFINERGGIDHVSVLESEPAGIFEDAALKSTLALQFSPARKSGRTVKSLKTIQVTFDPYESINTP